MNRELIVFWRHSDGTRCVVSAADNDGWLLRIVRDSEEIRTERFDNPQALLMRAQQLRAEFKSTAA